MQVTVILYRLYSSGDTKDMQLVLDHILKRIPGRTEVISIALYNHVEALRYTEAHLLAAILLAFCFLVLLLVYAVNRRVETPRL